jgi:hypothetical protein
MIIVKEQKNFIINLIKATRKQEFGHDALEKTEHTKYAQVSKNDPHPFFITKYNYLLPLSEEKNQRM